MIPMLSRFSSGLDVTALSDSCGTGFWSACAEATKRAGVGAARRSNGQADEEEAGEVAGRKVVADTATEETKAECIVAGMGWDGDGTEGDASEDGSVTVNEGLYMGYRGGWADGSPGGGSRRVVIGYTGRHRAANGNEAMMHALPQFVWRRLDSRTVINLSHLFQSVY